MDRVLILLIVLLLASLSAFFLGIFPYPYGLIILSAFIAARFFWLRSDDGRRR
ncbi:MAG: hypothetical protein PVG38_07190 [Gammaproteobacteria bacterium]|jgi:hypothetical protein